MVKVGRTLANSLQVTMEVDIISEKTSTDLFQANNKYTLFVLYKCCVAAMMILWCETEKMFVAIDMSYKNKIFSYHQIKCF